jgi:hypothetical protein
MESSNRTRLVVVVLSTATMGVVACGSDTTDTVEGAGGNGGTAVATTGGTTATGNMNQGGVIASAGGAGNTRGGNAATNTGGRNNSMGGLAMAGFPSIDRSCMQGSTCTADCSAACPGSATTNYTCSCTNGALACDLTVCMGAISTGNCPSGTQAGNDCAGATATPCTPTSGGTMCVCNPLSSQWTCF